VLLSEPGRTDYDLNFSIFGFEVRTHPAFFIMPVLLGRALITSGVNTGVGLLLLIAIFYVSILVHELGHAIAFRYFGIHSRIVLYWMGGLAIPDAGGNVWKSNRSRSLTSGQQIVVSLAGPVFGLLLAGLLCLGVLATGGSILLNTENLIWLPQPELQGTIFAGSDTMFMVFWSGIILNVVLNLFNLVPIYPLDGGQVARQLMVQIDQFNGLKNSLILSIAACVFMIFISFKMGGQFMAIFFAVMAWSNWQMLQQSMGPRW
jgi:Zn-dependent protease